MKKQTKNISKYILAFVVALSIISCDDNTASTNATTAIDSTTYDNFNVTVAPQTLLGIIGRSISVKFIVIRHNNFTPPITLKSDVQNRSICQTFSIYGGIIDSFSTVFWPMRTAIPGIYQLKFTAESDSDKQEIVIPLEIIQTPKIVKLISSTKDTLSLKVGEYVDIKLIPIDSLNQTIDKTFFDSLNIYMQNGWSGSNSIAIGLSGVSHSQYTYRVTARTLFLDRSNTSPIEMVFALGSQIKYFYFYTY